jgi:hypothetical protein
VPRHGVLAYDRPPNELFRHTFLNTERKKVKMTQCEKIWFKLCQNDTDLAGVLVGSGTFTLRECRRTCRSCSSR